ncbi:response regulator receiver domain-containing protein [Mucilaginibacter frigoritolerans]|jgi:DNA-binding response OmpR family regulator|uniref:Response regulator receiver domain-containing protein n=1 Tax=Mucilaginibacter frigoritolerans TaxID=652788 RepID=A0A562U9D0_9SPHI|nr:response regulator [Mucilaginibacter frigoritolerans]TWJ02414.1 response regulator receiver domain-containing protein [Mucilaginibacter frigoritolerans]
MELLARQKRILILDNSGRMTSIVNEIMEYGDFAIHTIYDPNAVYDRAIEIFPDLIILDYLLLSSDCEVVCRDIKEDKHLKEIPVIVVTAYKNKKVRADSYKCDAIFLKPVDMQLFAPRIDYLMAS